MKNRDAGCVRETLVDIRLVVATTNRSVDLRTDDRNVRANAGTIDSVVADSLRVFAELIGTTGVSDEPAADDLAFSDMIDRDLRRIGFALVSIRHAIATANRIPHVRTARRNRLTHALIVTNVTRPGKELAETVGIVAWDSGDTAADLRTDHTRCQAGRSARCVVALPRSVHTTARTFDTWWNR